MDHVNNAVYADWLDEAILAAPAARRRPGDPPAGAARVRPGSRSGRDRRCRRLAGRTAAGPAGSPDADGDLLRARLEPLAPTADERRAHAHDRQPRPGLRPDAYRASLLAALGDDDPAVAQRQTSAAIRALVAEAGDLLRVRPEPGEWSVLECVGHIADSELVAGARERWIVSEDEPQIVGYDQALWVDRLEHNADDPEILVATFAALRGEYRPWARRPVTDRPASAAPRGGPESYEMTFRLAAGHDLDHLAQAAARSRRSERELCRSQRKKSSAVPTAAAPHCPYSTPGSGPGGLLAKTSMPSLIGRTQLG